MNRLQQAAQRLVNEIRETDTALQLKFSRGLNAAIVELELALIESTKGETVEPGTKRVIRGAGMVMIAEYLGKNLIPEWTERVSIPEREAIAAIESAADRLKPEPDRGRCGKCNSTDWKIRQRDSFERGDGVVIGTKVTCQCMACGHAWSYHEGKSTRADPPSCDPILGGHKI